MYLCRPSIRRQVIFIACYLCVAIAVISVCCIILNCVVGFFFFNSLFSFMPSCCFAFYIFMYREQLWPRSVYKNHCCHFSDRSNCKLAPINWSTSKPICWWQFFERVMESEERNGPTEHWGRFVQSRWTTAKLNPKVFIVKRFVPLYRLWCIFVY